MNEDHTRAMNLKEAVDATKSCEQHKVWYFEFCYECVKELQDDLAAFRSRAAHYKGCKNAHIKKIRGQRQQIKDLLRSVERRDERITELIAKLDAGFDESQQMRKVLKALLRVVPEEPNIGDEEADQEYLDALEAAKQAIQQ